MKDSNVVNIGGDNNEKIDNSNIDNTAKKGSAVGDGNDITNKKIDWFWIFLAGFLTAHLLRFGFNYITGQTTNIWRYVR